MAITQESPCTEACFDHDTQMSHENRGRQPHLLSLN